MITKDEMKKLVSLIQAMEYYVPDEQYEIISASRSTVKCWKKQIEAEEQYEKDKICKWINECSDVTDRCSEGEYQDCWEPKRLDYYMPR